MAAASLALQSLIPGSAARQRSHMFTQVSGRVKRLPYVGSMCIRRRPCSWIFAVPLSCVTGHSQAAAVFCGYRLASLGLTGLSRMLSGLSWVWLSVAPVSGKGCCRLGLLPVFSGGSRAWVLVQDALALRGLGTGGRARLFAFCALRLPGLPFHSCACAAPACG